MKAFSIILNLLAIIFSIIVLTYGVDYLLLTLVDILKGQERIYFDGASLVTVRRFLPELKIAFFIFIFPVVNLAVLMNKYSMMDKYLVKLFSWNLSKVFLICIWLAIIAVFGIVVFLIIYLEHHFVWPPFSSGSKSFIFRMCLISLVVLGLLITFKNKKPKVKQPEKQTTDS
ncbi:MAG: hypothetical protein ACYSSP_02295 [Planctomycetota bacterium]|jgi:hypothetical protein